MKLSKYVNIFGLTTTFATAQIFGLPNQKLKEAQAHCAWNHPHHCKLEDFDPTKLIPGSAEVAEEAWGEAGRGLYSGAAEFMSIDNNHIPRQSLDSRQKELLRPEFGSLVDRVTVQYGADMMDRWGSGNFQISQGSAGQTFCNEIYIQVPYTENDYSQLILLAHEMQHSRQCENLGGMSNFGYRYFKEYKKAGQSYENNSLEREAENVAGKVEQYIASQGSQPNLRIMVHLQDIGDVSGSDNDYLGTRGESKRLEGFNINLLDSIGGGIEYMTHLQDIGDTSWISAGNFIGTRGESRRLEGFAIRLTGDAARNYNVFYVCHLQDIGDTQVYSNGQFCGTRGQSRRLEGMKVWIQRK